MESSSLLSQPRRQAAYLRGCVMQQIAQSFSLSAQIRQTVRLKAEAERKANGREAAGKGIMGNEANCNMTIGKRTLPGRALLETSEIIFRPADKSTRVKIPFVTIKSAKVADGNLRLETPDGKITFDLGPAAAKWCDKILNPKTRIEKLGVKPQTAVCLIGEFADDFQKELRAATTDISAGKSSAGRDIIFLSVSSRQELSALAPSAAKSLSGSTALWIVYPKGKKEITENDVLSAGRKAGLKDVKVVGFSPTHTALKFVTPIAKR